MKRIHILIVTAAAVLSTTLAPHSARAGDEPRRSSFAVKITGKGQPVILIPGLSSSGAVWEGTVEHLKDRYQCHVLTLAGFAGQPRIPAPFLETVRKLFGGPSKSRGTVCFWRDSGLFPVRVRH